MKLDKQHVYARAKWARDIAFKWYEEFGYYGYLEPGFVTFKTSFNKESGHWGVSRVGQSVLMAADLVVVSKIKEEEEIMKNVNYIGGNYKIAAVHYLNADPYTIPYVFKVDIDTEIKEGDTAVAESSKGLGLVKVVKVLDNNMENAAEVKRATAWIIQVVDMSRQLARKEATERREYLLNQLEEKKQQVEAINMYKLLAEIDPEAAKMLEELKKLS